MTVKSYEALASFRVGLAFLIVAALPGAHARGQVLHANLSDVKTDVRPGEVGPGQRLGTPDETAPRIIAITPKPGAWLRTAAPLSQFSIQFDEMVTVPGASVTVWSLRDGILSGVATAYDNGTNTLTLTLSVPIQDDRVTVILDYTITDQAGNALDGEVFNPVNPVAPVVPTGNGQPGGRCVFRIHVLQGDANRDGLVDSADGQLIQSKLGTVSGQPGFTTDADLNDDGVVNILDVALFTLSGQRSIPATDGARPRVTLYAPETNGRVRGLTVGTVELTFSEPIRPSFVDAGALYAVRQDGSLQPSSSVTLSMADQKATFTFSPALPATATYLLTLSNAIADTSGELLDNSSTTQWSLLVDANATRVESTSPTAFESMVAVTRETVITLRDPINPTTVGPNSLRAEFAGQTLSGMLRTMPDGKRIKLFYVPPLPSSARVRVTLDGTGILDDLGQELDADGDGIPGGTLTFDFDTCTLARIPNTVVWGRVFASEPGPMGENLPIQNVKVTVDGFPGLSDFTDANGFFSLGASLTDPSTCDDLLATGPGVPVPEFFVHISGQYATAIGGTPIPSTGFYPNVGKPLQSSAGRCTQIEYNGTPFDVFLPFITNESLTSVVPGQPTQVGLSPSAADRMAELFPNVDPAMFDLLQLTIPADSLTNNDGSPGTVAGLFPVDSSRLPAPLGAGNVHTFDITIQTQGAGNFDTPAPICFPNLPDVSTGFAPAPGEKRALASFNHDTGQWESVGGMTVMPDGMSVCTDPGVGIIAPGWHNDPPFPWEPWPTCTSPDCSDGCCDNASSSPRNQTCQDKKKDCDAAAGAAEERCNSAYSDCVRQCAIDHGGGLGYAQSICAGWCHLKHCTFADDCEEVGDEAREACLAQHGCSQFRSTGAPRLPYAGVEDLILKRLREEVFVPIERLIEPYAIHGVPLTDSTATDLANEMNSLLHHGSVIVGGSLDEFLDAKRLAAEGQWFAAANRAGPLLTNAPKYGVPYRATIVTANTESPILELAGITRPFGQYSLFVPLNGSLMEVVFYDHAGRRYAFVSPFLATDAPFRLPAAVFVDAVGLPDYDADGLADIAEKVLGTKPWDSDSDDDGILDGLELDYGTDPLDGLPASTGIITSSDTAGTGVDVCAINDLAIVADSGSGISVIDVRSGQAPVVIARVDTDGTAFGVACAGDLIPVADGSLGLAIIDVSDPPAARVIERIGPARLGGGSAQAIAAAGGLAFVGTTSGVVTSVELATGVALESVTLGGRVEDLAIEGETLFAYANNRLYAIRLFAGPMQVLGSVAVSGSPNLIHGRGRLFVGGNIAHVTRQTGYNTFDVSNPAAPTLIGGGNSTQNGWKQIVVNGSGVGVAAVGPNPAFNSATDHVYLYDTSNPTQIDSFLTLFQTPGVARSVAIHNGLCYVADGESGMHVINYRAYDALGQPPTGTLSALLPGSQMTEGDRVVIRANVQDDVQVRNVEFLVDGQSAIIDGSFPFEFAWPVPVGQVGQVRSFTAVTRDTGGNRLDLGPLNLTIIADTQSPTAAITAPTNGTTYNLLDVIDVTLTLSDNVAVSAVTVQVGGFDVPTRRQSLATWRIEAPSSGGSHAITAKVFDPAGNMTMAGPVSVMIQDHLIAREFSVYNNAWMDMIDDVIAREFSVYNDAYDDQISDVISREFSVYNEP